MGNKPPSQAALAVAAYIPTLTGSLSVLGSSAIISSILSERETKLGNPQNRILLGLSFFDVIYSFNKAILFLTYPKGIGLPGAQGNAATCTLQGFLTHFSYPAGTYSAVLSIYYYLSICHGVKSEVFGKRIEPFLHAFIIVMFLTFAIVSASIGLYNPTGAFCFIAPYPTRCNANPNVECTRFGDSFAVFYQMFAQLWIQLSYVIITYTNLAIWLRVRRQEQTCKKYSRNITTSTTVKIKRRNKHTRRVAVQSFLYVACFFLSWSFVTVYHLVNWIAGYSAFWVLPVINTLTPLQGFWNAFIFARPRYLRIKKSSGGGEKNLGFWRTIKLVFFPTTQKPTSCERRTSSLMLFRWSSMLSSVRSSSLPVSGGSNNKQLCNPSNVSRSTAQNQSTIMESVREEGVEEEEDAPNGTTEWLQPMAHVEDAADTIEDEIIDVDVQLE